MSDSRGRLVTSVLEHPVVASIDARSAEIAERLRGHAVPDRCLYALSQAANHSLLWHGINAVDALAGGKIGRRRALRRSVVLAVEQAVVNGPVKMSVHRRRPVELTEHPHALRSPLSSSFPSGHASAAACAATLLSADLGLPQLWWGLAGTVAYSRVHVGLHHASDVVAGAALGRILGLSAGRICTPPRPARRSDVEAG